MQISTKQSNVYSNRDQGKIYIWWALISMRNFFLFLHWICGACEWRALRRCLEIAMNWKWIDRLVSTIDIFFYYNTQFFCVYLYSKHNFVLYVYVCVLIIYHLFLREKKFRPQCIVCIHSVSPCACFFFEGSTIQISVNMTMCTIYTVYLCKKLQWCIWSAAFQ